MSSKPLKTSFSLSFSLQGRLVERVQEASEVQSDQTCLGWARAGGQAASYLCQKKLNYNTNKNIKPHATIYVQVQNVWISEQEHLRQFLDGADWFVDNQDDNGGWPSQVRSEQTNNQNVISKSTKNRMNRLNKFFFLPGHVQSREQKVSRSGRGCPRVVRCNVSGAKFARKQMNTHKNNFITGSLLIFKDEMPCSMH